MRVHRFLTALLPGLALAAARGPGDDPTVRSEEVITLVSCQQKATPCTALADGKTAVAVTVCTPVMAPRVADLVANLHLSSGVWSNPSDPGAPTYLTVPLTQEPCAEVTFIPDFTPGPVRIEAESKGFRAVTVVQLAAAPLGSVELSPLPMSLAVTATNQIALFAVVRAQGGTEPSVGTTLSFKLTGVMPSGILAQVYPDQVVVDAAGKARADLVAAAAARSITVSVVATPPGGTTGLPAMLTISAP